MSVLNIRDYINTKLGQMGTLKANFTYPTGNPNGKYPFSVLTLDKGEGEYASIAHNKRTHSFKINVYQEQSKEGQGVSAAENIALDVLDEILNAFDMDTTLSGNCKFCRPVSWNGDYENRELDVRVLQVELEAVELVAST